MKWIHQRRATRHPRWKIAAITAFVTAVPTSALVFTTGGQALASVPPAPSGWTTVFSDDFNGAAGTGLNTSNWLYDTGTGYPGGAANWGTGEVETMTSSTANVYQDGAGNLAIKPIRDANGNWTSGRVETQRTDLGAPAGGVERIEARIQQPNVTTTNGAGYWPAFWALGAAARPAAATNWPSIGELDVMEDINGRSSEFATLHCGTDPGGPCNETTGIGSGERACSGCQTGFHTYAVEIDRSVSPEQLRYYLDGNNFFTINANQVDATTWSNAVDHGFFVILNVAMGGGFPAAFGGGPNGSTVSGQPMLVDYVAVYQKGSSGGGGGGGTITGSTITGPGGKCIDVSGDDTGGDGAAVQLWDCQPTAVDQHWTYTGNTLQTLGRCMDVTNGGTANGTKVQLWDCNGTGAQQWVAQSNGSLLNPQSGRCLDDPSGSTANGARLQLWDCNGTTAQHWTSSLFGSTGGGGGGVSATSTIQAEAYSAQSGTQTETTTDTGGGQDVGYISNGDWLQYNNVNFGSSALTQFKARVASGAASGVSGLIEVHLDSLSNPAIGSFALGNTGGWQSWETIPANISGTTGTHTVYLKFTTGSGQDFVNVNWFTFSS
jgi:hypothetical protein